MHAIVQASNSYGSSAFSSDGNGAVILTVPDAPTNLQELTTNKSPTTIGLQWLNGTNTGGSSVLDYSLMWDSGVPANGFTTLLTGIITQTYLLTSLTPGTTYSFKVQSRNIFGLSSTSNVVAILSAFKPA